jgi:chromate reductase, NAD(P)H dehydrogenase (quinone)
MDAVRLLVVPGSARAGSFNRTLAEVAAGIARRAGADVTVLDLRALALPVYDGDLEAAQGVPPGAIALRDALLGCDAVLVVTPEYNGFPTPLVINAFDWLSRVPASAPGGAGLAASAGKPCALMSASPGPLGGLRSMNTLRQFLQMTVGMLVSPTQHALGRAGEAFDADGALVDPKAAQAVEGVVAALLRLARALKA